MIETIGHKGVLILGRFTPERKSVLDALRSGLRSEGFVPMMFDFERPTQRDFTETIKTLAGLSYSSSPTSQTHDQVRSNFRR